jgi:cbb3-type cytochrome oxidase subunit 3
MNETTPTGGSSRRKSWLLLFLVLLALAPSAYLFVTGRQQRNEMAARTAAAESAAQALADSLDAARTQLLVDRVLVLAQAGRMNQTSELASQFFDRVDRRSRVASAPLSETETRLRVLALRDQAITALTLDDPAALQIIEEIAALHLPLGDPTVGARIPTMTVPEGLPAPGDTARRDPDFGQDTDTLGSR